MQSERLLEGAPLRPADLSTEAPRYTVEPATSLDDRAVFAMWDIKTHRIVKLYRSRMVALNDARFLNTVRPPLPLG